MESNKNNNNNNGGDEHQQLRGSARKRKLNELTNDGDKSTGEEDQPEAENCSSEEGNDLDVELERLSREELIKLVQKQMTMTMEAQKQMETAKKEAEEFSQRNIQLEHEKAEIQNDLHKKMAEIVEMHKEVEEKSEELAKKAKQIDTLLIQLNESTSHQHQISMPMLTEQEMKIQLAKETWYDWLGFVGRHQLGQIVPMIGDRRFASIVQPFLHEYGETTVGHIGIVAPYEEDPHGPHPRVRAKQNHSCSYFDQSVLNFLQKFQQNNLLDNVNLWFSFLLSTDKIQPVLCHILPLINGIVSIYLCDSAQLVDFYDAANSKEIYEMNMKMMEETRILSVSYDPGNLHANSIDLYCRWLYQPTSADGKLRVLYLGRSDVDSAPISHLIDRLKHDFLMSTDPVSFFIRIRLPKAFQLLEAICLDNNNTKERFQTEMVKVDPKWDRLQISRHPLASKKKWIVEGKEYYEKTIYLTNDLKVVGM